MAAVIIHKKIQAGGRLGGAAKGAPRRLSLAARVFGGKPPSDGEKKEKYPAYPRKARSVKMPSEYADNPTDLGGEGTHAPSLEAMEAAAVLFQRVQRDRLRGRLVIAPRVHLPIIANEIKQSSLNLWRFVVFFSSTVGLLVLISFQMNPALYNDMRNSDGSLFRSDWSTQDAVNAAINSVEHDGVGSSYRDVQTTDDLWDWLEAAVDKLYDETATIGGYNKEISHLDIIQERRKMRKCDSRLKASVQDCFMDYNKGTPDDYTGEWVSASNFKPKELDSVICSSRPFPGTHEPRVPCANISTAFECTTEDYKGKCTDELPINWFYARAINGGKEGFKLGIDLGIYKQGKKAALHRLAAARTAKWLDRQTRRVTVQIVTLNPNIDVIVSLDIGFFFDLGGHTRISRASYMFRTNNMYQASSRSIMRVSLEVLYFVLAVRWSMQSVAMILIALMNFIFEARGEGNPFEGEIEPRIGKYAEQRRCRIFNNIPLLEKTTLNSALVSGAAAFSQWLLILYWWILRSEIRALELPAFADPRFPNIALDHKALRSQVEGLLGTIANLTDLQAIYTNYLFGCTMLLIASTLQALQAAHPRLAVIGNTLYFASGDLFAFALNFLTVNVIFLMFATIFFGAHSVEFKTFDLSLNSLMRWFMGDFGPFDSLLETFSPNDSPDSLRTTAIFWMYVLVNTIFFQNMLLCIVIDAFYEASALGKAAPMVQEDIRFCCHHFKFGMKSLTCYEWCAKFSRKKKKEKRDKEREARIAERGGIKASAHGSFTSDNPLKTIRKSEVERFEHVLEAPRKKRTSAQKAKSLKPKTFISETTKEWRKKLKAKRHDTGRRHKKKQKTQEEKEEKDADDVKEAEGYFCFPFVAVFSVIKVLLRPLKEVKKGTNNSDPCNALHAVAEHSAFKGEVLPNGEGASQAPVKYETTIAQVCYNLQMQDVHPWIIDRIAVRLENLVRGGAEKPMRELRVSPVMLRARTKYDAFNSKAEFDRISEQLADLVAAQPGARLTLDEKREGLHPYEIYKDGSARDCLSVEIDKMQRAVEIAEVVRDVIGAIGAPRQGVETGAAWRAKIDVQTKGMTDAARCRWLEAQLIGTDYRHGSDGATVVKSESISKRARRELGDGELAQAGWTQKTRSSGKVYYSNQKSGEKRYDRPTRIASSGSDNDHAW